MAASFFFYDLETSGISPRSARIVQFAGQRTDMELRPIGEPFNIMIKLTPDIVPEPDAVIVTGITPQMTLAEGITEYEFLQIFDKEIVQPDTIFMGFNTVRFDDEFMRHILYRNFYDAYEWQWMDDCSRWDLLDVVRMTRALRPDGIEWPFTPEGTPTNRLELLTKLNGLDHEHAHDALNDVLATIAVAKLIRDRQPKLFEYLLSLRRKRDVAPIVRSGNVFTYTSGKYPKESWHTTAAVLLAELSGESSDQFLVYDLRHDPTPFIDMSVDQLIDAWKYSKDPDKLRLPVKTVKCNRCPAITPGFPQDAKVQERLQLAGETVTRNLKLLQRHKQSFAEKLVEATRRMNDARSVDYAKETDPENQLYDSMLPKGDKPIIEQLRKAEPADLHLFTARLQDKRLKQLLPRYKARNFPESLSDEERQAWDAYITEKVMGGDQNSQLARYFKRLMELSDKTDLSEDQRFLLEELQLYGQSLMPSDV